MLGVAIGVGLYSWPYEQKTPADDGPAVRHRGVGGDARALRLAHQRHAPQPAGGGERRRLGVDRAVDLRAARGEVSAVDLLLELRPPLVAAVVGEIVVPGARARFPS